MDKKNHIIGMVVVILVIAGGSFYGGMQYGTSKAAAVAQAGRGAFGGGANGGARGGAGLGAGAQGGARGAANGAGGGFVSGQIVSKDDTSITIKSSDGSSKIVFFSGTTGIDKSVSGASSDLSVGEQVTAIGKTSSDGSLAAQSIQIRPAQPAQSPQQN